MGGFWKETMLIRRRKYYLSFSDYTIWSKSPWINLILFFFVALWFIQAMDIRKGSLTLFSLGMVIVVVTFIQDHINVKLIKRYKMRQLPEYPEDMPK